MTVDTPACIPPPDENAHNDGRLMHDVAGLNARITRYLLRFMDAVAGRTAPIGVDEERTLADELSVVSDRLRLRAEHRATSRRSSSAVAIEADQPRALEPSPTDMGNALE